MSGGSDPTPEEAACPLHPGPLPACRCPLCLTRIPDELPGLGLSEGGDLGGPGMAAGLLEAPEGHALAVDDAVRQRLRQALLVFLQGRAVLGPPDPCTVPQRSPRSGVVEPGQLRTARGCWGWQHPHHRQPSCQERSRQGTPSMVPPRGWLCEEETGMARGRKGCSPSLVMSLQSLPLPLALGCHHNPQLCPGAQRSQTVPSPGHPPSPFASPPLPLPRYHRQTHRAPRRLARPACPPAARSSSPSAGSCVSAPAGLWMER